MYAVVAFLFLNNFPHIRHLPSRKRYYKRLVSLQASQVGDEGQAVALLGMPLPESPEADGIRLLVARLLTGEVGSFPHKTTSLLIIRMELPYN